MTDNMFPKLKLLPVWMLSIARHDGKGMVEGKALEAMLGADTKKRVTFNLIVGHDDFRSHPIRNSQHLMVFRQLPLSIVSSCFYLFLWDACSILARSDLQRQ